ncbi:phenylalanine--tRNA ligase subunit alpha [Buchnera aphidicola]|uniref:Phenylalanine--tRNA ligase alpha subunit n=1 Tax=Buchnera aphidicola subsp. Tuberolachnus salignus TaxID=98804 RepID=A0A160SWN0_BUCTT|nr:phenylalanine--tRNA ligase subunit alpha [Buchnera aphidicola]CUR53070.1 Phenylalanine--tRNA ligase alpha subunit [Buchnera aphidicola (Tuberolachnus salignus)]
MKSEKEIVVFLKNIFKEFLYELKNVQNVFQLDILKSQYLGKKSVLVKYLKNIKNFPLLLRKKRSIFLNTLKKDMLQQIFIKKKHLKNKIFKIHKNIIKYDVSLPGRRINQGGLHPITLMLNKIKKFFYNFGFVSLEGPEVEDEYHNFDALNVPKNHPSKRLSDTFWFDTKRLLRTQTSSMQIRALEKYKIPFRIIIPGKVYRHDLDMTHTPMFHQIEGLIIEPLISFSNLKWLLNSFLKHIFSSQIEIRFRTSFFPFTVPSLETDIKNVSGQWLEILGGGMVHPNVLKKFHVNSKKYSACAFGIGIERIAMIKYHIKDIRNFFENNIDFLKQFKSE